MIRLLVTCFVLALLPSPAPAQDALAEFNAVRDPFVAALSRKPPDIAEIKETALAVVALQSGPAVDLLVERGLLCGSPEIEVVVQETLFKVKKGSKALERLCVQANQNEKATVRLLLCEPLTMIKDDTALKALLTNLYDPHFSVIAAAVEAVEMRNDFRTVRHLIDALEYQEEQKQGDGVNAHRIRKALTKLTALDFYTSAAWRKFWDAYEVGFRRPTPSELEKLKQELSGLSAGKTTVIEGKRPPPKKFFGLEVRSQRIVFVIDVSSSMAISDPPPPDPEPESKGKLEGGDPDREDLGGTAIGGKKKKTPGESKAGENPLPPEERERLLKGPRKRILRMQAELCRLLDELPEDTEFNVVAYSNKVVTWVGTSLMTATDEHKSAAKKFINQFGPDGETWTDRALDAAFACQRADTIILLSDGSPVRNRKVIDCFELLDELEVKNRLRRIQIHTVGFAGTAKEVGTFLREVARLNWGQYREIP